MVIFNYDDIILGLKHGSHSVMFFSVLTMSLVGMILFTNQLAFAGFVDEDLDGYQAISPPCEPQVWPNCDPNDNDPCIPDEDTDACKALHDPIGQINEVKNNLNDLLEDGDFNINSAQTKTLFSKLNIAIKYITSDKINLAINNLNAFTNMINAYINSGKISPEDGQQLISDVNNIINSLQ